jgi:uncharacterized repeat protein (TIGR01451 family)
MENKKNAWKSITAMRKILSIFAVVLAVLAIVMAGTASAKSVYVIAAINAAPTPIEAYDIQGTILAYQATHNVPSYAGGAVGLGIDTDSETLFVTYEFSNTMQLLDAKTFADLGTTTALGASNLAGITMDQDKGLLYTVDRGTNSLYVYDWDASTSTLTLVPGAPFLLPGLSGAYGIALDEINGVLYVADYSGGNVKYYSTNDWTTLAGSFTVIHSPIGIAVDSQNGYVYTGAGWGGSTLLSKYDMTTSTETTTDLATAGVMGLAVDPATGLVYLTTGYSGDDLRVFDSGLNQLFQINLNCPNPSPTGLCVPGKEIGYNPLNLSKDDGLAEDECVSPGANINYDICYDNTANAFDVHNVTINDTLPAETSFISASDGGTHNPVTHTVTWNIGTLSAGAAEDCVQLVVRVDPATLPETNITNYCTIASDETPPTTISEDTVTCKQNPLWHEINKELDALIGNVSNATMPNIIKNRLVDKLEYAKALKDNAHEECEADNFDGATKKLGVAKNQVESFASMVEITRRISPEGKASFLADATEIIGKIEKLIGHIENTDSC